MRRSQLLSGVSAALLAGFAYLTPAAAQQAASLSGAVTSQKEGPMEGVVVTAKKDGSNVNISVISDDKGRYAFPAAKVGPGKYTLSIRATGYELDGAKNVEVKDGANANDIKLKPTRNLSKQLTNAEWMMSIPGTEEEKIQMINCVSCHTHERIMKSTYDADEFVGLQERMASYAQVSQPVKPQRRMEQSRASNPEQRFRKMAEYLATINLSQGEKWNYELKTLPRVSGRGTKAVITEYDLGRPTIEPHDVIVQNGTVYYTNFGEQFLGKLDPATGKHSEYPMKIFKPGFPTGNLDIGADRDGNLWMGMMYQASIAKFDPKSEQFTYYPVSPERNKDDTQLNMVTLNHHIDGKIWVNDAGPQKMLRLDVATGKYEDLDPIKVLPNGGAGRSIYDVRADSKNNVYLTEFQTNYLMRIDAKTLEVKTYQTPTNFSRNRRGRIDENDRFWFAQYRGNKITMFDTKTEAFKEFPLPTKYSTPYDVIWDKNGDLWTGGMTTDRVIRLNPKSGVVTEYPLPRDTNIRRVFIDDTTTPPTFWVGNNHMASIVKVEPLD